MVQSGQNGTGCARAWIARADQCVSWTQSQALALTEGATMKLVATGLRRQVDGGGECSRAKESAGVVVERCRGDYRGVGVRSILAQVGQEVTMRHDRKRRV